MYEAALNRSPQVVTDLRAEHRKEPINLWPLEISQESSLYPNYNEIRFALYGL
jgi:hypothetical protein